jgi:site-specific DNA recombinase
MPTAAIYARVSSARQKDQQTIQSQTAALLAHAAKLGLDVPREWVFEDDGCSGATLVRPALERLRDLVCQVPVELVLCYAPDRLARRYAYQALLVEEVARAGTEVVFCNGPVGDRPEDALLVQFQGMIAEYEKAQIIERTRRGKAHRAKAGVVNVLSGAPYGYRYVRKSDHSQARYELVEPEASVVRELFRRYVADGVSIAELARWLSEQQIPTRTGKARWDRSTVWGMLRNPAYAGRAAFSKTMRTDQPARLTRPARLQRRSVSANPLILDRPREDWVEIAVPPIVSEETFQLAARRLADNQRFAARNTKLPSLLQAWRPARVAATPPTGPRLAPPTRSSTTTGAWAPMTTATPAGGCALTAWVGTQTSSPAGRPRRSARARSSRPPARSGHRPKGSTADAARCSPAWG